jgi:alginate O-acetyltransferase complex protein AlgI
MLFNSFQFVFFFIIVTSLYFALPHKYRWFMLLMASCYFYMSFIPIYILILLFTIIIDYYAGIYLEKFQGKKRKTFLIISLIANVGILAVFKYYNFINDNISSFLGILEHKNPIPYLSNILPIGLSFHTFQAMSYTIEVYRGNQKAEKNFGIYALYVMFYPQLVAGPIERPQNLLHQFYEYHEFDYERVVQGLKLMLWGLFKKIVIADRLSIYVNAVYSNPDQHFGFTLILATIFFAFQIYCDFSGYSEIAIGSAQVMGFKLMTNFKRPYFAKSVSEFWKRWHISLSTWFSDYLYISLGGNRVSIPRWYFNLFFVFLVSGLWHGANWTFIIWGALNGLYLIFALIKNRLLKTSEKSRPKIIKSGFNIVNILITFALICLSWVFFRANSAHDAFVIIRNMFKFNMPFYSGGWIQIFYGFVGLFFLIYVEFKQEFYFEIETRLPLNSFSIVRNYLFYAMLLISIILVGVFDAGQFIYFQF